ncbi:MAG: pyridoxal-phosphate dependent enzyme [Rhizobiaceae bacterium]|nr:pyridoxal-phosphate dependent enzyme [Rhizobiaceae bacterium]
MTEIYQNPLVGKGIEDDLGGTIPQTSIEAEAPLTLLQKCPAYQTTPLTIMSEMAKQFGVAAISIKDERGRMNLGSFKALGAAYVIACDAVTSGNDLSDAPLKGSTYITASAGNHGLSVAAGARIFGANAVIYLSKTVPKSFAGELEAQGAQVVWHGDDYEESMQGALDAANANEGWILLSDSSWPGYEILPYRLMEGYLAMAAEMVEQIETPPTHLFLQAGVGGLAAGVAGYARHIWGKDLKIIVVEPEFAPALIESVKAERIVETSGPVSEMGRLDCKTPSLIALKTLAKVANSFVTISEAEGDKAVETLEKAGIETTASAAAGIAPIFLGADVLKALSIDENSHIAAIISEKR